jgi:hypothetical protein
LPPHDILSRGHLPVKRAQYGPTFSSL